jgi:hypothetical protein
MVDSDFLFAGEASRHYQGFGEKGGTSEFGSLARLFLSGLFPFIFFRSVQPQLEAIAEKGSKKYSRCHYLDYGDLLVEGFYDSGRCQFKSLDEFKETKLPSLVDSSGNARVREVLFVDSKLDWVIKKAQAFVRGFVGKPCCLLLLTHPLFCCCWLKNLFLPTVIRRGSARIGIVGFCGFCTWRAKSGRGLSNEYCAG